MPFRLLLLPALFLLACGGNAPPASGAGAASECDETAWDDSARACEDRTLTLDTRDLRVDATPNGGIRVEAWDRDEIEIVARVVASAPTAPEAEALLSQVRIESGASVRARVPEPRDDHWVSVSYTLRAPRDARLDLRTVNGGIAVNGVEGQLRARAVNGGLTFDGIGGEVAAETVNGGISLRLARGLSRGDVVEAETMNGGIDVTASGGIDADVELRTENGSLRVPDGGSVTCTGRRTSRVCIGGRATGTVGRGGATVRLATTNGSVVFSRAGDR